MTESIRSCTRLVALSAVLLLSVAFVTSAPSLAHSNTCAAGHNSNYVVIVFKDGGQTGSNDDICWIGTHSYDDGFALNESGVDDIGENSSYHDNVSSMSVKNFGQYGLCVRYYRNESQSVLLERQWIGSGQGDIHYSALVNDEYDSLDLALISQADCLN